MISPVARKTLSDLERSPQNIGYLELIRILRDHGCTVREGTKHGVIVRCGDRTLSVPRHDRIVKPIYVREAVRALRGG